MFLINRTRYGRRLVCNTCERNKLKDSEKNGTPHTPIRQKKKAPSIKVLSLSFLLSLSLLLSQTHTHTHTLSLFLSLTHTQTLSHTHTHTLSLSLSLSGTRIKREKNHRYFNTCSW